MYQHRIFNIGEQIHCLLSSFTNPNILIPIKAIVKDAVWDDINSKYLVKILKFYDSLPFLKKYLFEMNFYHSFDDRCKPFRLPDDEFKTIEAIEIALNSTKEKKYYVVVDSMMTFKTKLEMQEKFDKIQYYIISRHLKDMRDVSTRGFYHGVFRLDSKGEFDKRLYKFAGDLFEKKGENFDRYVDSL